MGARERGTGKIIEREEIERERWGDRERKKSRVREREIER